MTRRPCWVHGARGGAVAAWVAMLTLTLTAIAADSALAGGRSPRLGRRLAAVLSIFARSAVGAVLVSLGGLTPPLVVTGACILLVAVVYAAHPASKTVSGDTHH